MNYRLVALDMDGTTLNEQGVISQRTQTAIRQAAAAGVIVTLATGRMFSACRRYAEQLGMKGPLITYNGALVKTYPQGEEIFHQRMALDIAGMILDYSYQHHLYIQVYVDDKVYVDHMTEDSVKYGHFVGVDMHAVGDLRCFLRTAPTKMMFIHDALLLDEIATDLRPKWGQEVYITKSKPRFLELTDSRVSKGKAVQALAQHLHIPREQVVAIGDSYNDVDMLAYAGLGVAMGNAPQAVQQQADDVTGVNDDDGVAQVIENYILR